MLLFADATAGSGSISLMDILTLIGGLALFLYGMHVMSAALEKSAGNKLKSILANMTSNTLKGFALGLGVTLVIQSSSATTVMVVGFVNSGIMTLKQAVGVIMGANLGTSITAWILSLSYIGGSGAEGVTGILDLFSTDTLVPIIALLAVVLIMFQKNAKRKDIGMIMMGFAVLMFGMDMMSGSVAGLKDNEQFKNILVLFSNPILGVIVGTVFTAIIQSSSASVGILQALTTTGAIPFATAIPIIMGQNIGTCVSAMISSVGASKNAKRAAVIHLSFNVIATLIILPIYYLLVTLIAPLGDFVENTTTNPLTIAIVHTLFKLVALCLLMPCSGLLVKLSTVVVKDGKNKGETQLLDERLMATPTVAVTRSKDVAVTMAKMSVDSIKTALGLLTNYNSKVADSVREDENKVDSYEDKLGSYLVKLSCEPMTEKDSNETSMLLHLIGDFERISDHAVSIAVSAEEISDKKLSFSPEAQKELQILSEAVCEILDLTYESFRTNDLTLATKVEPLEQVIDRLRDFMKRQHIDRLGRQECTIELGFIFSDLITCLERVSDHCSNIAGCILEMSHENMDIHSYLSKVKSGDTQEFNEYFEYFSTKYENQLSGSSAESVSSSPAQS